MDTDVLFARHDAQVAWLAHWVFERAACWIERTASGAEPAISAASARRRAKLLGGG